MRQKIENTLIGIKRDVLILSIKKHTLSETALQFIQILDQHLPKMVEYVRTIFKEGYLDVTQAGIFYNYLMEICLEALGEANLPEMLIEDDTDMVEMVKNQFIEVVREIHAQIV